MKKLFCCRTNPTSFSPSHDFDEATSKSKRSTGSNDAANVIRVQPKQEKVDDEPEEEKEGEEEEAEETECNIDCADEKDNERVSSSTTRSIEDKEKKLSIVEQTEIRRGGLRGQKVDTNIEIPTYAKTNSETEAIRCALLNNDFLRGIISAKDLDKVVAAMSPRDVLAQDIIIKQGEHGDQFYVSERGSYRIEIGKQIIDVFKDQRVFGELAVLYKNPRGATIQALSDGRIWAMDGPIFQALRINSVRDEDMQRLQFLQLVPSVQQCTPDKLRQIAKLMTERFYAGNAQIIRQGDKGDRFFVVKAGRVRVLVDGVGQVNELDEGKFFGEKALIEADVRQATCIAEPPGVTCLELSRADFDTYLGDFQSFTAKSTTPEGRTQLVTIEPNAQDTAAFDAPGLSDLTEMCTIGVGGFGHVLLVKDHKSQCYALKKLNKAENKSSEQKEHTMNEKRIQIQCRSPFIVRLFCTYQNSKYLFFLMEACMGGDLFSLMQRQKGRCFDEDGAQFIAACILEALAYLHNLNFIYRDLKPENMLIDADGYIKLADFGFAKRLTVTESTYTFAGTPEYVAPEVIYNKGHNRAVDYWAFGIFVFELLVGKTPFKTNDPSYMKTYGLILKGIENIQFPSRISKVKNCTNLIRKLCKLTPHERLGCQKRGVSDIRDHKWFSTLNWDALHAKQIKSKFVPKLTSTDDTTYFDEFDTYPDPDDDDEIWPDF